MHDFVSYLFYLLQRGMRFAVPAALVCGLILAVCYAVCRRQGRRFPWGKAVCAVLLVGWAAVTVFVTLLRSEPNEFAARQCNLQLFRAWREAYQRFTLQIWLNVLLNIALFVPLGVLLPLLWKPFRKWYAALGAGFGVSLLIELTQLLTARGMCDVDDLFTNTLGAMLGWCAAMLVLALHQKSRTWPRYCALPAAFALALSAIFISYAAQPYGNLRDASVTTADLSGVRWSVDFALDEDSKTSWVYQAQALDNAGADRFAAEFAAAHGVEFPDAESKGLMAREEYNLPLTKESYDHLREKVDGRIIHKTRYIIPMNCICPENAAFCSTPLFLELDIFHDDLAPLILAEIEFPDEETANTYPTPQWLGKDVTFSSAYHNSTLSKL